MYKYFLPLIVVIAFASKSTADHDPYESAPPADLSQAWCEGDFYQTHGERDYSQEGAIAQIGPYFFRICRGKLSPEPDGQRVIRFFYNPRRVKGLRFDKTMTGLMVIGTFTWQRKYAISLSGAELVETRAIGDVTYEIYQYFRPRSDPIWGRKIYLYAPERNPDQQNLPPHIIDCSKELDLHPTKSMSCSLQVGYDQIWASLLFIGGGPERTPIPVEAFPIFAQDVLRVLQAADVTDEVDALKSTLPILD